MKGCKKCKERYYVNNKYCLECSNKTENCINFKDETSSCNKCKDEHVLSNSKCIHCSSIKHYQLE